MIKVRSSKNIIACIEVQPAELRAMADRLDKGGMMNEIISVFGSITPKETLEMRFMLPLSEKVKRAKAADATQETK